MTTDQGYDVESGGAPDDDELLGGGEEIEQEKKFTRPRFVQVRFVGILAFFYNSKII